MVLRQGIIPALAGNTCRAARVGFRTRDHPRACGEHRAAGLEAALPPGSSPRLRGTRCRRCRLPRRLGIIPALAGNTSDPFCKTSVRRDHPRACGEHKRSGRHRDGTPGSSPRLRGTRSPSPIGWWCGRIIPALAGNTPVSPLMSVILRDHPRACGEHRSSRTHLSCG